jgi:hypothetical protein
MKELIFIFQFLSLLNIFWSTQLQDKYMHNGKRPAASDYFTHSLKAGSVCQFGIDSGKLLILIIFIQIILTQVFIEKKQKTELKNLMYFSIAFLSITFALMLLMNSGLAYKRDTNKWERGLFENSIPFFVCQTISIILMSKFL